MKTMKFKRAILVLMLLVMTISSVTGGTIAWFTDSVASDVNVLAAGNLDVELYKGDGTKVSETTKLFTLPGEDPLWEPGAVTWENLTVKNEGNLHLYYTLSINVTGENLVSGTNYGLSSALKMKVVEGGVTGTSREDVLAQATGGAALKTGKQTGTLAPDAEKTYGVIIYWEPSSADNNWNLNNGKVTSDGAAKLNIALGVNLEATQHTYESDTFNNQYDAGASLSMFAVTVNGKGFNSFTEAMASINAGDTAAITLNADVTDEKFAIPANANVTLNMNGHNMAFTKGSVTVTDNTGADKKAWYAVGISAGATLTIKNGNMSYTKGDTGLMANYGTLKLEGGVYTVSDSTSSAPIVLNNANSGVVNAKGVTFTNSVKAMTINNEGEMTLENCTVTQSNPNATDGAAIDNNNKLTLINCTLSNAKDDYQLIGHHKSAAVTTIMSGTYTTTGTIFTENGTGIICGGTFNVDPSANLAGGYTATKNGNGTWTVDRKYTQVTASGTNAAVNGTALANAINATTEPTFLKLEAGTYKMPSISGDKEFTIVGDKNTVIDLTLGAYMDSSKVSFEGVTIKGSTGYVYDDNGNKGSDYAALYTPNVTYTDCTFDGPFRIGRDGATFINCTFTNLGNDYVWTYGNDATFKNCIFESAGKALLIYKDGGKEVSQVVVENCVFNATKGAKAGAISNQNCAVVEIDNSGCGVNLTTSGNVIDSDFSGEWRIKTYHNDDADGDVFVNGKEYTTIALDGKAMTITGSEVTVID